MLIVNYMDSVTEYEYQLDTEGRNYIKVMLHYEKGLKDVTVIYYTEHRGVRVPLVTYDTVHGYPHRDIRYLDEHDKRRKKRLDVKSLEEFYRAARENIASNWRRYLKEFKEMKTG